MALATIRPPRLRERRHYCPYRYVRKVGGWKYQARLWIGDVTGGTSYNLGLYPSDAEAHRVARAVVRNLRGTGPLDVWTALQPLIHSGLASPRLLPKYAYRRSDGWFGARVNVAGNRVQLGPFADPADATLAMVDHLRAA